jgi:Kef-type K+ transport system membrane component KefB
MNLFIAVFLVSLGINMEVHPDRVDWAAAVLLALFVTVAKPLLLITVISRMGYSLRSAFSTGITLSQISEFSFILVALGMSAGYVGPELLAIVGATGLVSFGVSSWLFNQRPLLFRLSQSAGLLRPFTGVPEAFADVAPRQLSGHVIVIGMNTLGREIVQRLHQLGETVLAIDTDGTKLESLPCETMLGSVEYLSLLLEAGLPRAKLVVSALMVEEENDLLAFRCSYFGVPSSIHAIDVSVIDNLLKANTTYLMLPKVDGIKWQTRELKKLGFIK